MLLAAVAAAPFLGIAMLPQLGGPIHIGDPFPVLRGTLYFVGYFLACFAGGQLSLIQPMGADRIGDNSVAKNKFFTMYYITVCDHQFVFFVSASFFFSPYIAPFLIISSPHIIPYAHTGQSGYSLDLAISFDYSGD